MMKNKMKKIAGILISTVMAFSINERMVIMNNKDTISLLASMEIVELKDWRDSLLTQIEKNYDKAERLGKENANLLELAKKIGQIIELRGE